MRSEPIVDSDEYVYERCSTSLDTYQDENISLARLSTSEAARPAEGEPNFA